MGNNYKEKQVAGNCCSFLCFKHQKELLEWCVKWYGKEFERMEVRLVKEDGYRLIVVGIYSPEASIDLEKTALQMEYKSLKNEFNPDPEDARKTDRLNVIETPSKTNIFSRFFKRK